jgi:hypothetical protein
LTEKNVFEKLLFIVMIHVQAGELKVGLFYNNKYRSVIENNYLDPYETENQKSNNTLIILIEQHRKLKQDYIKLETFDQRLKDELEELKIKYKKMHEDLEIFNDLESLKRKAERRKHQLTVDNINMIKQRQITQMEIQTLQS